MAGAKGEDNRKHPRFETSLRIHFNLNPDHHYVPNIRKRGVAGTVRNVSREGLGIDSQMCLQDVCQIFAEAIEDDSPFELEVVFWNSRGRLELLRGSVRWYQVSLRNFKVGLYLKDDESRAVARSIVKSAVGRN